MSTLVEKLKQYLSRWVEVEYLFGRSQEVAVGILKEAAEDYIVLGSAPGCVFECVEDDVIIKTQWIVAVSVRKPAETLVSSKDKDEEG